MFEVAVNDASNPGWRPALMYWQFVSDLEGKYVETVMGQ
jgi:hypothetical protein